MLQPFKLLACLGILACLLAVPLRAQDDEETSKVPERRRAYIDPVVSNKELLSIGLHGGFASISHSGAFVGVPGQVSCCPSFSDGSGSGIVAGLDISLPLSEQLRLLARVSYQGMGGLFETTEPTTVRIGNEARATTFLHTFDASLSMIAIEPAVEYLLGNLGLVGGVRLGLVSSGTFAQIEELGDKSIPYTFNNGTQQYVNRTGDLVDMSAMQIGLLAGIRYHLVVGSNLRIIPEVAYAPNLTKLQSDMDWSASSLRVGASVMLTLWGKNVIATPLSPRQ